MEENMTTIAVVKGSSKNGWKVLVNYIQRGVELHDIRLANSQALAISKSQPCNNLILAREDA